MVEAAIVEDIRVQLSHHGVSLDAWQVFHNDVGSQEIQRSNNEFMNVTLLDSATRSITKDSSAPVFDMIMAVIPLCFGLDSGSYNFQVM